MGRWLRTGFCLGALWWQLTVLAVAADAGGRVWVERIDLHGNQVFDDEELQRAVARRWAQRWLAAEDIEALRQALTRYYVDHGYVNSGAQLPQQDLSGGVLRVDIVEGRLSTVQVHGNSLFDEDWLVARVLPDTQKPLQLAELQRRLLLLQEDPLLRRVDGRVLPGTQAGDARLDLGVEEVSPYWFAATYGNDRSPGVGARHFTLSAGMRSLSGRGDALYLQGTPGDAHDGAAAYTLPLSPDGLRFGLSAQRSDDDLVEAPFDELDIRTETNTLGASLALPVWREPGSSLEFGLSLEREHSESTLDGEPFSFSPGEEDGRSTVTVLRVTQDWLQRSSTRVLAAHSALSFGLSAFGATVHDDAPDSRFTSWLGQFQWVQRHSSDLQWLLRAQTQLASQALLPQEKFGIGGLYSVRGFRENLLVRDNGAFASLEGRIALGRFSFTDTPPDDETGRLWLAPFVDWGRGWNKDSAGETLSSVGIGLRWQPVKVLNLQVYKGWPLQGPRHVGDDLQDRGIHFQVGLLLD